MTKTKQISFRLPESEYKKIADVHANAKERTLGYAPLGDVVREAIGLIPLKIITQAERDYLSGRLESLPEMDEVAQTAAGGAILMKSGKRLGRRKVND